MNTRDKWHPRYRGLLSHHYLAPAATRRESTRAQVARRNLRGSIEIMSTQSMYAVRDLMSR